MSCKWPRQLSALSSVRATPISVKFSGSNLVRARLYRAGTTRRLVRSPVAPKMTMAQGSAGWACRRGGASATRTVDDIRDRLSSMTLLRGLAGCRAALRLVRLRFRLDRFLAFDMSAEAEAHGREHLFAERVLLPRTESGVQRTREHVGGDGLLDRGLDGPAALTGILDKAREVFQL